MKRMYVLANNQKKYSKPFVQAAHALSQFALEHPKQFQEWNNTTLVFLICDNIEKEMTRLLRKGALCAPFHEPDYNDRLTAICIYTNKKFMNRYKLM